MSNNYSEQMFQAIDTIISQRLNEVSFDKTEICEIISQDKNNKQKYWVTNGSLKFEAYSIDENKRYIENQKVYVTIPQGNYALRKLIIGSYSADETIENLYTNPFMHLKTGRQFNWNSFDTPFQVKANSKITTDLIDDIKSNSITFYSNIIDNFNYIGLEFSATTGFGGTKGEFQITIDLLDSEEQSCLTDEQKGLLTFSSKQLYGNPYYLNRNLKFQHLFKFPIEYGKDKFEDMTKVKKIKIILRSLGNFNCQNAEEQVITINDLSVYFGYEAIDNSTFEEDKITIKKISGEDKYNTENDTKVIQLEWYNKTSDQIYNFNQPYENKNEYYIYWYKYIYGYTDRENEEFNDKEFLFWKTIKKESADVDSAFQYELSPNSDLVSEKIKAVLVKKEENTKLVSNILTFENETPPSIEVSAGGQLEDLILEVPTGLIYNYYGEDGKAINQDYKQFKTVTVKYLDSNETDWNPQKQKVTWKIPKIGSMLDADDSWDTSDDGLFYVKIFNKDDENAKEQKDYGKSVNFICKDQFDFTRNNNVIRCDIERYDNETITTKHFGTILLQFGLYGTAGTEFSLNIYPVKSWNIRPSQEDYQLTALLTGKDGKELDNVDYNNLEWSWHTQCSDENSQYKFVGSNKGQTITLKRNGSKADFYAIIKAVYTDNLTDTNLKVKLTAYFPIAAGGGDYVLQGASRVVYNYQGTSPVYDQSPYKVYGRTDNKQYGTAWTWSISSDIPNSSFGLKIDKDKKEYSLVAPSFCPTNPPKFSLVSRNQYNDISWIQPILVIKNGYSSYMLNEWDGSLNVDKENNSILSALIGAGTKSSGNLFTGVLMGAVSNSGLAAKTGLYGFQDGLERFSLTEKGSVFIGTGDDNYISFNEGNKRSSSNEFIIKTQKFVLNTEKLTIDSTVSGTKPVIKFYDKFELRANGTATIGDWSIEKSCLASGFTEGYYTGKSGDEDIIKQTFDKAKIAIGTSGKVLLPWDSSSNVYTYKDDNGTTKTLNAIRVATKIGDNFGVTSSGILYAKGAKIDGTLTVSNGSKIGNWTISNGAIKYNDSVYLGNDGSIKLGNKFSVDSSGNATFSGSLSAATGTFKGSINVNEKKFYVDSSGNVTVSGKLTVDGLGTIAGWTISGSNGFTTTSEDTFIYTDGRLSLRKKGWLNAGDSGYWLLGKSKESPCFIGDEYTMGTSSDNRKDALGTITLPGGISETPTVGVLAKNGPIHIRSYGSANSAIRLATTSNGSICLNVGTTDYASAGSIQITCKNNLTLKPESGHLYIRDSIADKNRAGQTGYVKIIYYTPQGSAANKYLIFANGILVDITSSIPYGYTDLLS